MAGAALLSEEPEERVTELGGPAKSAWLEE